MKDHTKKTISLEEAKAQFEELLDELLAGEAIIITRQGKTSVKISAEARELNESRRGTAGKFRGKITMPSDEEWAAMDKEIEDEMLNGEIFPE